MSVNERVTVVTPSRVILALLASVVAPAAAQLAEPARGGFAVGPLALSVAVTPGQESGAEFTIVTYGVQERQRLSISVHDIEQTNPYIMHAAPMGAGVRSCARWITVPASVQLPPNARREIPVTVKCPPGARGAYYAFIDVRVMPRRGEGRFVTVVQPAGRVMVEAMVQEQAARLSMNISSLRVEHDGDGGPGQVVLKVINSGEVKTPLEGDILFRGPAGVFPVRVPLPHKRSGEALEIYPGATVDVPCPLPHPLPPGDYTVQVRAILAGERRMQSDFALQVTVGDRKTVLGTFVGDAAFKVNLQVEPDQVDLTLPKGARRTIGIRVHNTGDQELQVTAQPALVRIEPDGLLTYATEWKAGPEQWVQLRRDKFTLAPRRSTVLVAQVVIPKERPHRGTVACAVLVKARAAIGVAAEGETASVGEYPVLILARDPKASPAKLQSPGIRLIRPNPEFNPRTAVVRVKNTGGCMGYISGRMALEASDGQQLARLAVGDGRREPILPGGEREFRLALPFLDKGEYTVKVRLSPGREGEGVLEETESFTVTTEVPEGLKEKQPEEPE